MTLTTHNTEVLGDILTFSGYFASQLRKTFSPVQRKD